MLARPKECLMVISHMLAALTYIVVFEEVMSFRASGDNRGLSAMAQSAIWVSRRRFTPCPQGH